jgi:hypothetical protein
LIPIQACHSVVTSLSNIQKQNKYALMRLKRLSFHFQFMFVETKLLLLLQKQ